jgi:endonuclease-3
VPSRSAARRAAPASPKPPDETRRIIAKLERQHPNAFTELNFRTPYELLVATILSAQCTDERVNQVTPALFARYPDARALAQATTTELELRIQSTGFFRAKSRSLLGMATAVVEEHHGEIPATMDALVRLPGVGRKTANVVLGHALGVPGLPVDRHVLRVANRIGIAKGDDPEVVERQLCAAMPPAKWTVTSDTLILHGRRICKPKPLCEKCAVREDCDYYHAAMGVIPARDRAQKPRGPQSASRSPRTSRAAGTRASTQKSKSTTSSMQSRPETGQSPKRTLAAKRRGLVVGVGPHDKQKK